MILKSDNERHSYGPDKLVPPARQPASQPARIRQSNNQFFPSENLVNNAKLIQKSITSVYYVTLCTTGQEQCACVKEAHLKFLRE
ncbi:hypothetical protein DPMN_043350 [Dreissena polymorpha]|uniref:Uncharacterized protein n=1 Tax=Dreissena polymorpha TaxID=45954 RepID=A0A9D4HXV5_DREPO|nr:hypothetical protein DPMN_043350 [Dreissena polymorpha]